MWRYRVLGLGVVFLVGLAGQSLVGRSEQAGTTSTSGSGPFDSLHFRSIGPAAMSGRISDLAVYEPNPSIFYVGTAHGGVWKTVNAGTTFEAQFQDQGLMSIGDVTVFETGEWEGPRPHDGRGQDAREEPGGALSDDARSGGGFAVAASAKR